MAKKFEAMEVALEMIRAVKPLIEAAMDVGRGEEHLAIQREPRRNRDAFSAVVLVRDGPGDLVKLGVLGNAPLEGTDRQGHVPKLARARVVVGVETPDGVARKVRASRGVGAHVRLCEVGPDDLASGHE